MSVATFWAVMRKMQQPQSSPIRNPVQQRVDAGPLQPVSPPIEQKNAPDLTDRLDRMDKNISALTNRVWLLGVTTNENSAAMRKHGYDLIFFDEQWRLSRMPYNIQLNDEAKEGLKGNIR